MATGPVIRTMTKIAIGPKRATAVVLQNGPAGRSPLCRDHGGDCTSNGKCERSRGQDSPSDSHKSKQRHGRSTSPSHDRKRSRTPEGRPLLPPPMFHSTPLLALCRLSSDLPEPSSAHQSFNQSRSSLPPLNLGGHDTHPIYVHAGAPIQGAPHPL